MFVLVLQPKIILIFLCNNGKYIWFKCLLLYFPVKLFRRVMHNFRHFSPVLLHYRQHVIYHRILYTIMQHYATLYAN